MFLPKSCVGDLETGGSGGEGTTTFSSPGYGQVRRFPFHSSTGDWRIPQIRRPIMCLMARTLSKVSGSKAASSSDQITIASSLSSLDGAAACGASVAFTEVYAPAAMSVNE